MIGTPFSSDICEKCECHPCRCNEGTVNEMKIDLDLEGLAHELFVVAQLLPNEGIEDAVVRIKDVLIGELTTEGNKTS
jgi:hypothetical protein